MTPEPFFASQITAMNPATYDRLDPDGPIRSSLRQIIEDVEY